MAAPTIVPISPRTGREIKSPRKGQKVLYALRGPRGGVKPLTTTLQAFSRSDVDGFNRVLSSSDGKNFVLYEQLGRAIQKDARGRPLYRTKDGKPLLDAKGRKVALREVKLTARKRPAKQRPVVFAIGRTVKKKVHDYAFRKRSKREQVDAKLARIIPLKTSKEKDVYSDEIHLSGDTIFDTIKNLRPSVDGKDMKKAGIASLWVEGVVRVREPSGALAAALTFSVQVKSLWNFAQVIAKEVRFKLADVGYRFTSLSDLKSLQSSMDAAGKQSDIMRLGFTRKKVETLTPMRPETKKGQPRKGAPARTVSISLKITGVAGKKRTDKKKKTVKQSKKPRKGAKRSK